MAGFRLTAAQSQCLERLRALTLPAKQAAEDSDIDLCGSIVEKGRSLLEGAQP